MYKKSIVFFVIFIIVKSALAFARNLQKENYDKRLYSEWKKYFYKNPFNYDNYTTMNAMMNI